LNNRYAVEQLPNGLIRVFGRASQLVGCYHADDTYRHGDLRAATIAELLGDEARDNWCVIQQTEELVSL
jgi:hypothetical protein